MPKKPTQKDIIQVIDQCFKVPPEERAALILHDQGVQSKDINIHTLYKTLPRPQVMSVYNALIDLERKTP